jgi:hypothetical protein
LTTSGLRDETDLDTLTDDVMSVVRETLQPGHGSLWLHPTPGPTGAARARREAESPQKNERHTPQKSLLSSLPSPKPPRPPLPPRFSPSPPVRSRGPRAILRTRPQPAPPNSATPAAAPRARKRWRLITTEAPHEGPRPPGGTHHAGSQRGRRISTAPSPRVFLVSLSDRPVRAPGYQTLLPREILHRGEG